MATYSIYTNVQFYFDCRYKVEPEKLAVIRQELDLLYDNSHFPTDLTQWAQQSKPNHSMYGHQMIVPYDPYRMVAFKSKDQEVQRPRYMPSYPQEYYAICRKLLSVPAADISSEISKIFKVGPLCAIKLEPKSEEKIKIVEDLYTENEKFKKERDEAMSLKNEYQMKLGAKDQTISELNFSLNVCRIQSELSEKLFAKQRSDLNAALLKIEQLNAKLQEFQSDKQDFKKMNPIFEKYFQKILDLELDDRRVSASLSDQFTELQNANKLLKEQINQLSTSSEIKLNEISGSLELDQNSKIKSYEDLIPLLKQKHSALSELKNEFNNVNSMNAELVEKNKQLEESLQKKTKNYNNLIKFQASSPVIKQEKETPVKKRKRDPSELPAQFGLLFNRPY